MKVTLPKKSIVDTDFRMSVCCCSPSPITLMAAKFYTQHVTISLLSEGDVAEVKNRSHSPQNVTLLLPQSHHAHGCKSVICWNFTLSTSQFPFSMKVTLPKKSIVDTDFRMSLYCCSPSHITPMAARVLSVRILHSTR
ncbi:hypothetical protein J6590_019350 [Homalodisca vitripennis]|nr:hypothetical protein J6590_019350 [Homalodisca vitripennis]